MLLELGKWICVSKGELLISVIDCVVFDIYFTFPLTSELRPGTLLNMDSINPFPISAGFIFILVIIDCFHDSRSGVAQC